MDEHIVKSVFKELLPKNPGYNFVTKFKIGIPINCLVLNIMKQKESPLPFFQETVLKIVNSGWNNVDDIGNILGLEEELVENILGEMSVKNLIYSISKRISITPDGREVLEKYRRLERKSDKFLNLCCNLVTGELYINYNDENYDERTKHYFWEVYKCNNDYLQKNILKLKRLFIEQQKYKNNENSINSEIYELYSVDKIDNSKIKYALFDVYVYQDSSNKEQFDFIFNSESSELNRVYREVLIEQVKDKATFIMPVRKSDGIISKDDFADEIKGKLKDNINELIRLVEEYKFYPIANNEKRLALLESIDKAYYTDRQLLPGEYKEIIWANLKNKYSNIAIYSPYLNSIVYDDSVITMLTTAVRNGSTVFIAYRSNEYRVNEIITKINNGIKAGVVKGKFVFKPFMDISETSIFFDTKVYVNIKYDWISYVEKKGFLKEDAIVLCNSAYVEERLEEIRKLFI